MESNILFFNQINWLCITRRGKGMLWKKPFFNIIWWLRRRNGDRQIGRSCQQETEILNSSYCAWFPTPKKQKKILKYIFFLTFPIGLSIPIIFFFNLNSNCSDVLDLRNLQEQVKKAFCFKNCTEFWNHQCFFPIWFYNFFEELQVFDWESKYKIDKKTLIL